MDWTFRTHGSGKKCIQIFNEETCKEQTTLETQAEILCGDTEMDLVAGSFEHGNEHSNSINGGKFLD
jgi:hypothetical protein